MKKSRKNSKQKTNKTKFSKKLTIYFVKYKSFTQLKRKQSRDGNKEQYFSLFFFVRDNFQAEARFLQNHTLSIGNRTKYII